jgi:hypothetical protein
MMWHLSCAFQILYYDSELRERVLCSSDVSSESLLGCMKEVFMSLQCDVKERGKSTDLHQDDSSEINLSSLSGYIEGSGAIEHLANVHFEHFFSSFVNALPEWLRSAFSLKFVRELQKIDGSMTRLPGEKVFCLEPSPGESAFSDTLTEDVLCDGRLVGVITSTISHLPRLLCIALSKWEYDRETFGLKQVREKQPVAEFLELEKLCAGRVGASPVCYVLTSVIYHVGLPFSGCFGHFLRADDGSWVDLWDTMLCPGKCFYNVNDRGTPVLLVYKPNCRWSTFAHSAASHCTRKVVWTLLLVNYQMRWFPRDILLLVLGFLPLQ